MPKMLPIKTSDDPFDKSISVSKAGVKYARKIFDKAKRKHVYKYAAQHVPTKRKQKIDQNTGLDVEPFKKTE